MKKNYLLLIFLTFMVASCTQQNKKSAHETSDNTQTEEDATPQARATSSYDKLMYSFDKEWQTKESDPKIYPPYYGGAYIDDNNDLTIYVLGDPNQHRAALTEIIGNEDFILKTGNYSYKEMLEAMNSINQFLGDVKVPESHIVVTNFAGAFPSVTDNRVVVEFVELNDAVIRAFKNDVIDSPVVDFRQGERPVMQ